MRDQRSYKELLYQYEVLRARLEIRNYYLKTAVKEVYDNVGQVLSLIRVQLSLLRLNGEAGTIDDSGELVGKTIRDLRDMCQLLYPETDIVSVTGFNRAIAHEIKTLYPEAMCRVDEKDMGQGLVDTQKGLILFGVMLEILMWIGSSKNGDINTAVLKYTQHKLTVTIDCLGWLMKETDGSEQNGAFDLSIAERTELIGGSLQIKNIRDDLRRIKLVIPIN